MARRSLSAPGSTADRSDLTEDPGIIALPPRPPAIMAASYRWGPRPYGRPGGASHGGLDFSALIWQ